MNTIIHQALDLLSLAMGPAMEMEARRSNEVLLSVSGRPAVRFRLELWKPGAEDQAEKSVLWILKRASSADLERLREAGNSFVALPGAVRVQAPGLLIDRTDLPRVRLTDQHASRSAFSDRASLVPRTLFSAGPDREWAISDLAAAAGVSKSVASYAVRDLEDRSLLDVREMGRKKMVRMVSRLSLVEEWSREYRWSDNRSVTVLAPVGAPERFLERLPASLGSQQWAATLHAGASLIVRHAPVEEVHVYLDVANPEELAEAARRVGWKTGRDGLLHLIAPKYRTSLWQGVATLGGLPVVSPLQLILDLWNHPVRGREQARRLLEHLEQEEMNGA